MDDLERLMRAQDAGLFALPHGSTPEGPAPEELWPKGPAPEEPTPEGPTLLVNARPGAALATLALPRLVCVQPRRDAYNMLLRSGLTCHPTLRAAAPGSVSAGLMLATRNRAQTLGLLAALTRLTRPGGTVVLSGAKTDGIDALASRLRNLVALERFAKGHGKVLAFQRPTDLPAAFAEWEAAAAPAPNRDGLRSAPGMFSHAHADPGSRFLAGLVAGGLSGYVAELGAGYGWLARQILRENADVARLVLYEADYESCEMARQNLADPRAEAVWADVTALSEAEGGFDQIVTNPPFHDGRAPDPALGQAFIAAAARLLTPKGRLILVANRHLPYEKTMAAQFQALQTLQDAAGYKILEASRPRRNRR
ncbi:MAG: methyltransferase [Pseudomonadota bacterium]